MLSIKSLYTSWIFLIKESLNPIIPLLARMVFKDIAMSIELHKRVPPIFWSTVKGLNDLQNQIDISTAFYAAINTPRALALEIMLRYGEYEQLIKMEINPLHYCEKDKRRFRDDYHATSYLSKCSWIPTNIDKESVAFESFQKSEVDCSKVNGMFREYWRDPQKVDPVLGAIMHLAQRKISSILGSVPSPESLNFGFGPGSSSSCGGDTTSSYEKLQSTIETTINCLPLLPILGQYPAWLDSQPSSQTAHGLPYACLIPGSKLIFVPKSAKTDRSICIEPHLNGFIQKGIGDYIRGRLQKIGVDLSDQSKNAKLAREGSISGLLSTIDLSAASDSIAYNLVMDLLPIDWFILLDACRSPSTTYKGDTFSLEKFSSMGNGYTFELESLLFYSLVWAAVVHSEQSALDVSVYGDDIICPTICFNIVRQVLSAVGFQFNIKKSFSSGYFRESCGAHWFSGLDCKPFYFKEGIKNAKDLFLFGNSIRRLAHRNRIYGCDGRYEAIWQNCYQLYRTYIGKPMLGSEGFGDGYFICNWDECRPTLVHQRFGTPMYRINTLYVRSKSYDGANPSALFAHALYTAGPKDRASYGAIDCRRRVSTKIIQLYHHRWYDLGPWY